MYDIEEMKQITSIMKMAEKKNKALGMGVSLSVRIKGNGSIFDCASGYGEMNFTILDSEAWGEVEGSTENEEKYRKIAAKFFSEKASWVYMGLVDEVRFFEDEELVAIFTESDFAN